MADLLGQAFVEIRATGGKLASDISSELSKAGPAASKAGDDVGSSFGDKFKAVISAASKIGAAAFVAGLVYAIKAGNDLEDSQSAVGQAIKNTGGTIAQYAPALAAVQSQMEALGYTNADVNNSIATLTTATGSAKDAIGLEGTAANLAAAKHLSLGDATNMVAKAAGGNTKALKDMNVTVASGADWAHATASANKILGDQIQSAGGIANFASQHHLTLAQAQKLVGEAAHGSIPALNSLGIDVLPKTATSAQRVAELSAIMNKRVGGDAQAAAGTTEGKMKTLKAEFTDMAAKVGEKLLPVIGDLVGWLTKTHVLVPLVITAVGLLAAAFVAEGIVMIAANWPIVLIIGAIALLVVGITLLVTHWKQIWGDIKNWAADAWRFIWDGFGKYLLPLLGPVGLIALGVIEVWQHWKEIWGFIKQIAADFVQWIWADFGAKIYNFFVTTLPSWWDTSYKFVKTNFVDPVKQIIGDLYTWIWTDFALKIYDIFTKQMPSWFDTCVSAVGTAFKAIGNAVLTPINDVITGPLDGLISAFDTISKAVGGPSISKLSAISLASGGVIPGYGGGDRHLALLEGGEAVVPKEVTARNAQVLQAMGVPGFAAGGVAGSPGGGLLGGIWHGITSGVSKVVDAGKIVAALATGDTTALLNALTAAAGGSVGGAVGDLAKVLIDIPKTLIKDAVSFLLGKAKAQAAASSAAAGGVAGGGVQQWAGDVLKVLAMLGLPASYLNDVLYQMQTESGGNPSIGNYWDSNAAAGTPSMGLMQVIMPTFEAYRNPALSASITDPMANIYAALNYAAHNRGFGSGPGQVGSGHGYALGGLISEPIFGVGASGQTYSFGEGGRRETVVPGVPGGPAGGVTLAHVLAAIRDLAVVMRANPSATGASVGQVINGTVRAGAARGAYSAR